MINKFSFGLVGVGCGVLLLSAGERVSETPPLKVTENRPPSVRGSLPPVGVTPRSLDDIKQFLDQRTEMLQRPLTLYGKVVDEQTIPIPGALVRYSNMDTADPNGASTRGETETGPDGSFTVRGRGIGIFVEVSRSGYYRLRDSRDQPGSSRVFGNSDYPTADEARLPDAAHPAIFVLLKAGEAVALLYVEGRSIEVPKNGAATEIDLISGEVVAAGTGQLRVEVITDNGRLDPNKGEHYDWRCRLSVPGGGLVERNGEFDFRAPEAGYAGTIELSQSALAPGWRSRMSKNYFLQLADGRYARIEFSIITTGDHFVRLESFVNPVPGERNLEFAAAAR